MNPLLLEMKTTIAPMRSSFPVFSLRSLRNVSSGAAAPGARIANVVGFEGFCWAPSLMCHRQKWASKAVEVARDARPGIGR